MIGAGLHRIILVSVSPAIDGDDYMNKEQRAKSKEQRAKNKDSGI